MYKFKCKRCKIESEWQVSNTLPTEWCTIRFNSITQLNFYSYSDIVICTDCKEKLQLKHNAPQDTRDRLIEELLNLIEESIESKE